MEQLSSQAAAAPFPSHGPQANSNGDAAQAAAAVTATAALSQDHVPTPNATNSRKRRATGAPGSRGVANLTPDQLAKKRANDREAQRAIRERTRNTIDSLEQRIREFESQQPFQDLQRVVQERDRALAECEELRRRLGAVAGIAGAASVPPPPPQQPHPSLNGTFTFDGLIDCTSLLTDDVIELAALTAQQRPLPSLSALGQQSFPQGQGQHYSEQPQQNLHPELRSPGADSAIQTPPTGSLAYQNGDGTGRNNDHTTHQHYSQSPTGTRYGQQRLPSPQQHQHANNGDRLGLSFRLDGTQHSQHSSMSPVGSSIPAQDSEEPPVYARITNQGPPSCPLDSLLIDAFRSRQKMMQDGASMREAIGPDYPAFVSMVEPGEGQQRPPCHQVSALLIDILSKFPDVEQLPEKVAVLYIMFLVLRWLICPCEKCYERLPEWCRPTAVQLEKSHIAWADYLPWYESLLRAEFTIRVTDIISGHTCVHSSRSKNARSSLKTFLSHTRPHYHSIGRFPRTACLSGRREAMATVSILIRHLSIIYGTCTIGAWEHVSLRRSLTLWIAPCESRMRRMHPR